MNPYKKVAFHTLGCKLNFSETSTISRSFEDAGYAKVSFDDWADVYVINTCSVTEQANKKTKTVVNKAIKQNPESKVVVIGCYAQLKPQEIVQIKGVSLVLGANEKFDVIKHLEAHTENKESMWIGGRIGHVKQFVPSYSIGDRTRSFLKVQDGCDYFCTFCTIPLARGRSRNASVDTIVEKANEIAASGVKEVVLTGVNIGDFGQGNGPDFLSLIQALDQVNGIERFRISSIEPNLLTDEIITFVANSKKFVPHFHIPLQSGSDALLALMKRKYNTSLYTNRVLMIKELMPHACIGVDVIVGFPGETEQEFLTTYDFLTALPISYLHVFTYSERENTLAIKMDGVVPKEERYKRNAMLRILSDKKKRAFYQQMLGNTHELLLESENDETWMYGFTENYVRVKVPFIEGMVNHTVPVTLNNIDNNGDVIGEMLATYA
jgi:threonylcarbamoyladenosine tRNA methylthiotransferase MtaB